VNVPFIDLQRFEDGYLDRWLDRVRDVTLNTRFVGGADVARLEARLAAAAGVPHVVGCANGTDALQLALRALGVGPGDVVLIPDATFWATFEAVVNVGAGVVTVDIDAADLQMSFDLFAAAAKRRHPKAAILTHLYGWGSARLDDFRAFCRDRDLPLVEDGAQAWGVTWQGRPIFEGAEVATVSFYPAKVLGGCGDAGAVLCASADVADRVRRLGNHGRTSHYAHGLVGWNSRLDGLNAAWLDLAMDYLDVRMASRRAAASRYRAALAAQGWRVAAPPAGYTENGYLNVVLVEPDLRPVVEDALRVAGIGFGNIYPGAMSRQPGAAEHLAAIVGSAHADRLARSVLNLPLFAYIRDDEVDRVIEVMSEIRARTRAVRILTMHADHDAHT